jgi:AraC-like DNA-binding protein
LTSPNREELQNAYFSAVVLPPKTQESAIKLLSILAQHLGMLGGEGRSKPRMVEPAAINRARAYIQEHLTEKIYLADVAKVVNLNCFYFCKFFRRITGLGFTEYVAELRIEKSKSLLASGEMSITDVAFASGFHSLTHFNRVFKKLTGLSPTAFRSRISSE